MVKKNSKVLKKISSGKLLLALGGLGAFAGAKALKARKNKENPDEEFFGTDMEPRKPTQRSVSKKISNNNVVVTNTKKKCCNKCNRCPGNKKGCPKTTSSTKKSQAPVNVNQDSERKTNSSILRRSSKKKKQRR